MDTNCSPSLTTAKSFYFESDEDIVSSAPPWQMKRLLKVEFKSPKQDYIFIHELESNQGTVMCHRKRPHHLAVMRETFSPKPLQMLEEISRVQNPNVANILNVYFYQERLIIVSEYLDVSLLDLQFNRLLPEEWEIATIVSEVIKAMAYLLKVLPGFEIHIDSVRLSLQGDVKLVHDMHYQDLPAAYNPVHQYNSEFLVGILEVLMQYGTSSGREWSPEAIRFSSIKASDSLKPFMEHVFMTKSASPAKLIPRIRLATQILSCQSPVRLEENIQWLPDTNIQPSHGDI